MYTCTCSSPACVRMRCEKEAIPPKKKAKQEGAHVKEGGYCCWKLASADTRSIGESFTGWPLDDRVPRTH